MSQKHYLTFPHAVDSSFGPSSLARFESGGVVGCDCKKETFRMSYDATYDGVQKKNPHLSDHDLRVLTAQTFRPWHREDIASVRNEETGKVTEVEFEITIQGDFYFPSRGKTDTDMDDNTRKLNPSEYHPSDTLTNKAVHDAVAQGATHIVTSYFRPNQDHRDFVEFIIDPATHKGKLRVINASLVTGKTHEFKEMSGVATKIFGDLRIYTPTDRVFVATNKEMNALRLERAMGMSEQKSHMAPVRQPLVDTVFRDAWVTTKDALDYVFRKKEESITEPDTRVMSVDVLLKDKRYRMATVLLETTPSHKNKEVLAETWKQTAQAELHLSEEQSEKLLQEVVETHEAVAYATEMITFTTDTGVAIGAALFALDTMTLIPREHAMQIAIPVDIIPGEEILGEILKPTEKTTRELRIDQEATLLVVELVRVIDALPAEKQIERVIEEKQKVIETIALVWEKATKVVRSVEQTQEPKAEKQLSIAIAVWTILKLSNYLTALDHLEQLVKKIQHPSLLVSIRKEKPEGLVQKEPSPWILLSIIWYLAQIREQGVRNKPLVVINNKKKATNNRTAFKNKFPKMGIIFAL